MKTDLPLLTALRARATRLAAVAARQRLFVERLFGTRVSNRLMPIERVMRRAVLLQPVTRLSVHQWMSNAALASQRALLERHVRVEHAGAERHTERVLDRRERHTVRTLRERLVRHAATLLQRHAAVAPAARALRSAAPGRAVPAPVQPPWLAPRAVPPVHTTVLSAGGRASPARQAPTAEARRDEAPPRLPALQPGQPAAALVLPPQEMTRVTDHVMQQLDRRMVSYRERMGRA